MHSSQHQQSVASSAVSSAAMPVLGSESALREEIDRIIMAGLAEDVRTGDITTLATIPSPIQATGRFLVKQQGIVAGTRIATLVFHKVQRATLA